MRHIPCLRRRFTLLSFMSNLRALILTASALSAFAANSLLCRAALRNTRIDPAAFTAVRLVSGALTLALILGMRRGTGKLSGDWISAGALFIYAAAFSLAYIHLSAATGALLLFGAVQATMIGRGLWRGERLHPLQLGGLALALAGLAGLLLPGLSAPPLSGALLMLVAGVAWGIYSLRGKGAVDPVAITTGNFLRATPLALALAVMMGARLTSDPAGIGYAVLSGALASGVGYVLWYAALPLLKTSHAAAVQLCVPLLAALGGATFLGEGFTSRLAGAGAAILGGIALVIRGNSSRA